MKIENQPYVKSIGHGYFYARAIPKETQGNLGITKIYRVGIESDKLIDSYDWYSSNNIFLAWSSLTGKIAILRIRPKKGVEMTFYLGGNYLKSYTNDEMNQMCAKTEHALGRGSRMNIEYLGVEQIPWTAQSVFKINIPKIGIKRFDILTGEEFTKPMPAKRKSAAFDESY